MKTLKDIRDKVIADLDLYEEDFAEDSDIDAWIREGVELAEAEIHVMYQDYFLSYTEATALTGEASIDYPDDIYSNKIRHIIYSDNGNDVYEIKKSRSPKRELMYEMLTSSTGTSDEITWYPTNKAGEGRKIRLTPADALSGNIVIGYIRNANVLVSDADVCDIDEFSKVVEQHAKTQAYLKDGDPRAADSAQLEEFYNNKMKRSLQDMAADGDNEMEIDMSFYEESV